MKGIIACLLIVTILLLLGTAAQAENDKDHSMAKVGRDLTVLYKEYLSHQKAGADEPFKPSNPLLRIVDGKVIVDVIAKDDIRVLRNDLERLGLQKVATAGSIVSGWLPIAAIRNMAALESLRSARPAYASTENAPGNLSRRPVEVIR